MRHRLRALLERQRAGHTGRRDLAHTLADHRRRTYAVLLHTPASATSTAHRTVGSDPGKAPPRSAWSPTLASARRQWASRGRTPVR